MHKDFGTILAQKRILNHMSQKELSLRLESYGIQVSNAGISRWEKNLSLPNMLQFLALCEILHISDIYDVFIGENVHNPICQLNETGRSKLMEYADLLLLKEEYRKPREAAILSFQRPIPFSLLTTSAGPGNYLDDENFETIYVDDSVPYQADFGVRIDGDSMEPIYPDGSSIWIQKTDTLLSGDIGLFFLDGMTYCKQFKKDQYGIRLISLNPKYKPIQIQDHSTFKIFGKVLN